MMDTDQNSPINKLILHRLLSANLPRNVFAQIIYSNLQEDGSGAFGYVIGYKKYSILKQERIPHTLGEALLHQKKNQVLDNMLKL